MSKEKITKIYNRNRFIFSNRKNKSPFYRRFYCKEFDWTVFILYITRLRSHISFDCQVTHKFRLLSHTQVSISMQVQCHSIYSPRHHQNQTCHSQVQNNTLKQNLSFFLDPKYQDYLSIQRTVCINSQMCQNNSKEHKMSHNKIYNKYLIQKHVTKTTCTPLLKSINNSNDLILVYLMYKEQKLSLFLNKGVSFDYLIKKMYKQIYIYEKQTYCISNAILKNLLHKITGFQSIDNDILYDYEFNYKRGTLEKQKFFLPFMQQDHKTPFKIYTRISSNIYGGDQFLARNYSDGQWIFISNFRKSQFDDQKLNIIKKSLKNNVTACSLLFKRSSCSFSQINWLQTQNYFIVVSQYFVETLQQNLIKNHSFYSQEKCSQIFTYYVQWLAYAFKQMVSLNIPNFQKVSLQNIRLSPADGQPKIFVFDNFENSIDFSQRQRNVLTSKKRASQKIKDSFYFQTYLNFIWSLKSYLQKGESSKKTFNKFISFLEQKNNSAQFSFDLACKYFLPQDIFALSIPFNKLKDKHPLNIDFTSKLSKIVTNMQIVKTNSIYSNQQTLLISQVKEQVRKLFCVERIRKNQQRNQKTSILQRLSTRTGDLKNQNIGNLSQFNKEQERKYNLKKKQRVYIQEILAELNKNDNYIKTTKQNNVASIQFYLKSSDQKIKKKMVQKIETKYKKFFESKTSNQNQDAFHSNASYVTVAQDCQKDNFDRQFSERGQNKSLMIPSYVKSGSKVGYSQMEKEQTSIQISNFLDKQNFASKILGRLDQRNASFKPTKMSLKSKASELSSPALQKKSSKLQQLFINRKNYSKEEKMTLKKKKYCIYLNQAQKDYKEIKLAQKAKTQNIQK